MSDIIPFCNDSSSNLADTSYGENLIHMSAVMNRNLIHGYGRAIKNDVVVIDLNGLSSCFSFL